MQFAALHSARNCPESAGALANFDDVSARTHTHQFVAIKSGVVVVSVVVVKTPNRADSAACLRIRCWFVAYLYIYGSRRPYKNGTRIAAQRKCAVNWIEKRTVAAATTKCEPRRVMRWHFVCERSIERWHSTKNAPFLRALCARAAGSFVFMFMHTRPTHHTCARCTRGELNHVRYVHARSLSRAHASAHPRTHPYATAHTTPTHV